jgi:ABC-type transport system substrate-binding protein
LLETADTEKLSREKKAILIVSIIVLLFSSSFFQSINSKSSASTSEVLRMTLVVPPNSLNALTLTTGSSGGIFIGMEYYGTPVATPTGSLDTAAAVTDWISHNSNYTQWIFNVKPGLKWSDGTNVTSNDILTTFSKSFGFNSTYDYLGMGPEVSSEQALNSSAAEFNLNVSDAHWPDKFNWDLYSPIYPAEFINSQGVASNNFGTDVVTGPFYVSNYQSGQTQLTMLRNPYFYTTGMPEPAITQINVNFVESLSLTTGIVESGQTDLAPIEPSNAQAVAKTANIHILDEKGLYVSDLQYNDSIFPYNVTDFRQALAYGINQTAFINAALDGYGLPAYSAEGVVSPSASLWYNSAQSKYDYNSTQALALLGQMGITKGSDGHLQYSNHTDVTLNLWTDTDNTEDPLGAASIVSNLQSLGFVVNLQSASVSDIVGDYSSNLNGIRSAMILSTENPPVWGNPYLDSLPAWDVYWLATTPNPYWEYPPSANAEYESNYTALLGTANMTQEHSYLDNIQALNAANLPTLVLAYPDALWAYNTQNWQNWPTSSYIEYGAQIMNATAFAVLQPTSSSTSTTSNSTSGSSSSSSGSSTTSPSGTNNTLLYVAIAVVVIVVVAGVATYFMRRKPT